MVQNILQSSERYIKIKFKEKDKMEIASYKDEDQILDDLNTTLFQLIEDLKCLREIEDPKEANKRLTFEVNNTSEMILNDFKGI